MSWNRRMMPLVASVRDCTFLPAARKRVSRFLVLELLRREGRLGDAGDAGELGVAEDLVTGRWRSRRISPGVTEHTRPWVEERGGGSWKGVEAITGDTTSNNAGKQQQED